MSEKQDPLNGDFLEPKPSEEFPMTTEEKTIRMIVRGVIAVMIVGFVVVGGCTAHSNTYDAERLAEEAKIVAQETEASIVESKAKIAKVEAMERMVKEGANPVAVHCMMEGWNNGNTCMVVGLSLGKELPTE